MRRTWMKVELETRLNLRGGDWADVEARKRQRATRERKTVGDIILYEGSQNSGESNECEQFRETLCQTGYFAPIPSCKLTRIKVLILIL